MANTACTSEVINVLAEQQDGSDRDENGAHRTHDAIHEQRQGLHRRSVRHQERDQQQVVALHQRNDPVGCTQGRVSVPA
jgi:hypothetical protein